MGSSSWSNAYRYETESGQKFFVKEAKGQDAAMFQGEALGLSAMYGGAMPCPVSGLICLLMASMGIQSQRSALPINPPQCPPAPRCKNNRAKP